MDIEAVGSFRYPNEIAEIMMGLYNGSKRSKELPRLVPSVSEPTVYTILKELTEKGFINKNVLGRRNVLYSLTEKGKTLVEEEYLKARETFVSLLRDAPKQKEIIAEVLLEEMLDELPDKWKSPSNKKSLKNYLKNKINEAERDILRLLRGNTEVIQDVGVG